MIKAIVFDLDDTLISEREYVKSGFKAVSKKICEDNHQEQECVLDKMLELFEESSKEVFNRVLAYFKIEYSKEYIIELINLYRNHIPKINFFDDVIPTIIKLKKSGYKTGIITDGYKETQLNKIEVLKCRELFNEIIVTDELGREFWKPHEKPYLMMANKLNLSLEDIAYVGDNISKDFITANKLGITTIKIERCNSIYEDTKLSKEYYAKFKIISLYNLIDLLLIV